MSAVPCASGRHRDVKYIPHILALLLVVCRAPAAAHCAVPQGAAARVNGVRGKEETCPQCVEKALAGART